MREKMNTSMLETPGLFIFTKYNIFVVVCFIIKKTCTRKFIVTGVCSCWQLKYLFYTIFQRYTVDCTLYFIVLSDNHKRLF